MANKRKNFIKVESLNDSLPSIGKMTAGTAKEAVEYALLAAGRVAEIINTTEQHADYKTTHINIKDLTEVKSTTRYWGLTGYNDIDSYYIALTPLVSSNERGCYNVASTLDQLVKLYTNTINVLRNWTYSTKQLASTTEVYQVPIGSLSASTRIAIMLDASKGKAFEVCSEEQNIDDMPFDTLRNICMKYGKKLN